VRTYVYRSVTLTSYTGGEGERARALSHYGPVRAGLTTTQRTNTAHQLTELLNYLEKEVEILENKSLKVLSTSLTDTTHLVEPSVSTTDTTGTDEVTRPIL
jgi:hypothetical protein